MSRVLCGNGLQDEMVCIHHLLRHTRFIAEIWNWTYVSKVCLYRMPQHCTLNWIHCQRGEHTVSKVPLPTVLSCLFLWNGSAHTYVAKHDEHKAYGKCSEDCLTCGKYYSWYYPVHFSLFRYFIHQCLASLPDLFPLTDKRAGSWEKKRPHIQHFCLSHLLLSYSPEKRTIVSKNLRGCLYCL